MGATDAPYGKHDVAPLRPGPPRADSHRDRTFFARAGAPQAACGAVHALPRQSSASFAGAVFTDSTAAVRPSAMTSPSKVPSVRSSLDLHRYERPAPLPVVGRRGVERRLHLRRGRVAATTAASVPSPRRPGWLGRAPRTGAPAPPRAGRGRAGLRWWRSCCRATTGRNRAGHPGESLDCAGRLIRGECFTDTRDALPSAWGVAADQSTGHGIDKAVLRIRAVGRCRLRATARGSAPKDHVPNEPTAARCARWRSLDVIRASADRSVSDQSFRDSRLHPAEGETDANPVHVLRHSDPHVFLR